jgi:hypothetical protein
MKNIILKYTLKALCLTLALCIVATGAFALHLTHVNASITVTFGEQPKEQHYALADAVDMSALTPLPTRKPRAGR